MSRKPSRASALAARLIAAFGLAGAASAAGAQDAPPTLGQSAPLAPAQAPAAWVAYAEGVSQAVAAWLEEDAEAATTARAYLGAIQAEAGEPRPLELKVWIDPQGRLHQLDFPSFAHAEANQALNDALLGRTLPTPPPADMRQPLRIQVQPGE